jgi:hypothetical protein
MHTIDGPLVAIRNDNEQVDVAIFVWRPPGTGTKEKNLFRLEFGHQPANHLVQDALFQRLHVGLRSPLDRPVQAAGKAVR